MYTYSLCHDKFWNLYRNIKTSCFPLRSATYIIEHPERQTDRQTDRQTARPSVGSCQHCSGATVRDHAASCVSSHCRPDQKNDLDLTWRSFIQLIIYRYSSSATPDRTLHRSLGPATDEIIWQRFTRCITAADYVHTLLLPVTCSPRSHDKHCQPAGP